MTELGHPEGFGYKLATTGLKGTKSPRTLGLKNLVLFSISAYEITSKDGTQYLFRSEGATYERAKRFCNAMNGYRFAVIKTKAQFELLKELAEYFPFDREY